MQSSALRQSFLREASRLAQLPSSEPELDQHRMIFHKTCRLPAVTTMGLQTMSSNRSGEGRSFLKWAGGKTRYANQLAAIAPPFEGRYFEPFMGSAALFFELGPSDASLSDANPELVICFQQVAKNPEKVMTLLDKMPNDRDFFHAERARDVCIMSDLERAARVIYLNKTGFRGLWRVNKKGQFNVPYGAYDRPYYNRKTLLAAAASLQGVEICHRDFSEALAEAKSGDWVYLDPPYIPLGGFADFKRYTPDQFGEEAQRRLASEMSKAGKRGVHVTMTNSDTPLTRKIFAEFHMTSMVTRRDINLQAKSRGSVDLVYTTYEHPQQDTQKEVVENLTLFQFS
jgi:DNA adenine methylase